jgi:hypothetical protein
MGRIYQFFDRNNSRKPGVRGSTLVHLCHATRAMAPPAAGRFSVTTSMRQSVPLI